MHLLICIALAGLCETFSKMKVCDSTNYFLLFLQFCSSSARKIVIIGGVLVVTVAALVLVRVKSSIKSANKKVQKRKKGKPQMKGCL